MVLPSPWLRWTLDRPRSFWMIVGTIVGTIVVVDDYCCVGKEIMASGNDEMVLNWKQLLEYSYCINKDHVLYSARLDLMLN
jgi:hypothetical protein